MVRFISKRLIYAIVTLFILVTATFLIMFLIPKGPFLGERTSQAALEATNAKYELDQPVIVQYKNYLLNAMKFDFGVSYKRKNYTVAALISEKFPVTAKLVGWSMLVGFISGTILGLLAAWRRSKIISRFISFLCALGNSLPSFIISIFLLYFVGMALRLFPVKGLETPWHYVMPVFALSLSPMSYMARTVRSNILDATGQNRFKTAFVAAVAGLGSMTATILIGTLVVETVFKISGLGSYFVTAIGSRDFPVIMGTTIFLGAVLIIANLIIDLIRCVFDPRIRSRLEGAE